MTKSFIVLLFCLVSAFGLSQKLDSVQVNGEWRYVYPVDEPTGFGSWYYANFSLDEEQFRVWLEWKMKNDPRADLKDRELIDSIQMERYRRLEVYEKKMSDYDYKRLRQRIRRMDHRNRSLRYQRNFPEILYSVNTKNLSGIPPYVQTLPDGKYVQYFEAFASLDKPAVSRVDSTRVACLFELKSDNLDGQFIRLEMNGDTLAQGAFAGGFMDGYWELITTKDYDVPNNVFLFPSPKVKESTTSMKSNYSMGEFHGEARSYRNDRLEKVSHFNNGHEFGEHVFINYQDSVVYDVNPLYRREISEASFNAYYITGEYLMNLPRIRDQYKRYSQYRKLYRWNRSQMFFDVDPERDYFIYQSTEDSVFLDSMVVSRKTMYSKLRYPYFYANYKVYDRESRTIIFERRIDPFTYKVSGSTHYKNGQLFDTISVDSKNKCKYAVYTQDGDLLHSDEDLIKTKKLESREIDGFLAVKVNQSGDTFYELQEPVLKNDTLFTEIWWNEQLFMQNYRYVLPVDSTYGRVLRCSDGTEYEYRFSKDKYTQRFLRNGVEFGWYANRPSYGIDSVRVLHQGKPFQGEIEYRSTKKDSKVDVVDGKLIICAGWDEYPRPRKDPNWRFSNELSNINIIETVMSCYFGLEGITVTNFNGNTDGYGVVGSAQAKGFDTREMTVNYVNYEPNVHIEKLDRSEGLTPYYYRDEMFDLHNQALGYKKFRRTTFSRVYLAKSYDLVNGKVSGPMVFYTSKGDTTVCIPYLDGLKHGKAFQYGNSTFVQLEFRKDTLVNDLIVQHAYWNEYKTTLQLKYSERGQLISGKQFCEKMEDYIPVDEVITYTGLPNGNVLVDAEDNGEPFVKWEVTPFYCVENRFYNGVFPSYSLSYSPRILVAHQLLAAAIPKLLMVGEDGFEFGGSRNYSSYYDGFEEFKYHEFPNLERTSLIDSTYFKKYFPNEEVAREGYFIQRKTRYGTQKSGMWKTYTYNGKLLHTINYKDTVLLYAGEKRKVMGVQAEYDTLGNQISTRWLIDELEMYECTSDDYYAERQFITISSTKPERMNGWSKNYYDNGSLMNEGNVVNGIPDGLWKFYAPDGKLNRLGRYANGIQEGRWLIGDLSEKAYIGEVCIDPDSENYDVIVHNLERDKDVEVRIYKKGVILNSSFYGSDPTYYNYEDEIRSDIQLR